MVRRHQQVERGVTNPLEVGEVDGFEAFYAHALPGAVRLAHLLTGSVSTGQDVAQDAMVRGPPALA